MGGPKRPPHSSADEVAKVGIKLDKRRYPWHDLSDLSTRMAKKAHAGMTVTLSPGTAAIVAHHLSTVEAKPTRNEVALMVCRAGSKHRCAFPCTGCIAIANVVVDAYGARPD